MLTTLLAKYYHWFDLLLVFVFKQRFIMALTHRTSVHGDIIIDIRPIKRLMQELVVLYTVNLCDSTRLILSL